MSHLGVVWVDWSANGPIKILLAIFWTVIVWMTSLEHKRQFADVTANQNVDEQAMTFLRAFVGEFSGKYVKEGRVK